VKYIVVWDFGGSKAINQALVKIEQYDNFGYSKLGDVKDKWRSIILWETYPLKHVEAIGFGI
jgi:hypothetical protein